jgi:hypothetical protein
MTAPTGTPQKPRFIKPANVLKQKVGHGGIDEKLLEKSQHFIENNGLDFAPYAEQYLKNLTAAIKELKVGKFTLDEAKDKLVQPVMQLKANGGMFKYRLVSDIADIALQFIESVAEINDDTIEVLKAHQKTLSIIIQNKLQGDGGREGYALVKELDQACKRYFSRYKRAE